MHTIIKVYTLSLCLYFTLLYMQHIPTSLLYVKFNVWYTESIHKPVVICGFLIEYYDWVKLCPVQYRIPYLWCPGYSLTENHLIPWAQRNKEIIYENLFSCVREDVRVT